VLRNWKPFVIIGKSYFQAIFGRAFIMQGFKNSGLVTIKGRLYSSAVK
jgi:hypothetical protein